MSQWLARAAARAAPTWQLVASVLATLAGLLGLERPAGAVDPRRAPGDYAVQSWLAPHGLPQDSVTAILQAADGYLWIGTGEGLARFDGVTFTVYDRKKLPGLRSQSITALLEDGAGAIWIGTSPGSLTRLAPDGTHRTFDPRVEDAGLPDNSVTGLVEEPGRGVWVASYGGLGFCEPTRCRRVLLFPDRPRAKVAVRALSRGADGRLWLASSEGVIVFAQGRAIPVPGLEELHGVEVRALHLDREQGLWMGIEGQGEPLARWNGGTLVRFGDREGLTGVKRVASLFSDRNGTLWIGSDVGLFAAPAGRSAHAASTRSPRIERAASGSARSAPASRASRTRPSPGRPSWPPSG
jgi:ligand-binding sensor domain-containing protein